MATATQAAVAKLASIVGEARVLTDAASCQECAVHGRVPRCVVFAPSAEQAAQVLEWAAEQDLAVIPRRNGTKIETGNPPRRYDVALSLKEMNQVWYYEPDDLVISVEAGMKWGDLQHFLSRRGLWVPLDPPGGDKASVGGCAAAGASGPLRLRYGTLRDMVLGMTMATTEGKVVKTGGRVVKNVAGYDLAKLLIGSWGTLGVITEVTLKLFPRPPQTRTYTAPVASLEEARQLRRRLLESPLAPQRMVLLDSTTARLAGAAPFGDERFQVWIEAAGSERVLRRYDAELSGWLPKAHSHGVNESNWASLADYPALWLGAWRGAAVLKASLPVAATETFIGQAEEGARASEAQLACIGMTAVGVVRLALAASLPPDRLASLIERLRTQALQRGGSLIVERCPADVREHVDAWGPPGDDLQMMRRMKQAWDPKGILSPGRFVGGI
jgi:glycolate oxidase FAD binding subunit